MLHLEGVKGVEITCIISPRLYRRERVDAGYSTWTGIIHESFTDHLLTQNLFHISLFSLVTSDKVNTQCYYYDVLFEF